MIKSIKIICFTACLAFIGNGGLFAQTALQEKFNTAISKAYEIQDFELEEMAIPENLVEQMEVEMGDKNLFRINSGEKLLGYAYLGEAASMKRMFDYVVFFDENLIIKKSKVLIYREDFGRQIGTRRWLGQFDGMGPQSNPQYGENITAISGATISASSMTRAVNGVLKSIAVLQEEGVF